jgi:hypothetical protein
MPCQILADVGGVCRKLSLVFSVDGGMSETPPKSKTWGSLVLDFSVFFSVSLHQLLDTSEEDDRRFQASSQRKIYITQLISSGTATAQADPAYHALVENSYSIYGH